MDSGSRTRCDQLSTLSRTPAAKILNIAQQEDVGDIRRLNSELDCARFAPAQADIRAEHGADRLRITEAAEMSRPKLHSLTS